MCYMPIQVENTGAMQPLTGKYILVNCRQCIECRQQRAKEWGLRCMMEAKKWNATSFITLTYAPEHPKTGEKAPYHLRKEDLQAFKKRLRKAIHPLKIKTFDCGEYGSLHYRPHFHMLVFGYDFPDKLPDSQSPKGYTIYHSNQLEKLWGYGMITVQDLTLNSAAYCALYSSKPKKKLPKHLQPYPEFNTMSKGLGIESILENMETYLLTDEIWLDGKAHNIPQCALNKYYSQTERATNPEYLSLKQSRVAKGKATEKSNLAKLNDDWMQMIEDKRYRAESAEKRLTKPL